MLADRDIGTGLGLLSEWMEPYPWWYWFLLVAGNIPTYFGLIYVVFFSREGFRDYCTAYLEMFRKDSGFGFLTQFAVGMRIFLWFGLCIGAVIVQHHLLWKRFFGDV